MSIKEVCRLIIYTAHNNSGKFPTKLYASNDQIASWERELDEWANIIGVRRKKLLRIMNVSIVNRDGELEIV